MDTYFSTNVNNYHVNSEHDDFIMKTYPQIVIVGM